MIVDKEQITLTGVLLTQPLYARVKLTTKHRPLLEALRRGLVQVDEYCVDCGKESTFQTRRNLGSGGTPLNPDWMVNDSIFSIDLFCARAGHRYTWFFSLRNMELQKVGQVPSIEDIGRSELRKYQKVLGTQYFVELKRATGLVSHGIGIGSYVYLRRIFENLIEKHRRELEQDQGPIAHYGRMKMDEKIQELAPVLPSALVKNKKAYSILSQGIHELDEETCLKHFPILLGAILQILEQDYQDEERKRLERDLELQIARISSELGQAGSDKNESAN